MKFTVDLNDNEVKIIDAIRKLNTLYQFAGSDDGQMSRDFCVTMIVTKYLRDFWEKARNFE